MRGVVRPAGGTHTPDRGHGRLGASLMGPRHMRSRRAGFFLRHFLLVHCTVLLTIVSLKRVAFLTRGQAQVSLCTSSMRPVKQQSFLEPGHSIKRFPPAWSVSFCPHGSPRGRSCYPRNNITSNRQSHATDTETEAQRSYPAVTNTREQGFVVDSSVLGSSGATPLLLLHGWRN